MDDGKLRILQLELGGIVAPCPLVLTLKLQEQGVVVCSRKTKGQSSECKVHSELACPMNEKVSHVAIVAVAISCFC